MQNLEIKLANGRSSLQLVGELTIYTVTQAKAEIIERLQPGMALDLGGVEELDTAGVQLLVWLKRRQPIPFIHHSQAVVEVLDLLNVASVLGDPILLAPL